MGCDQIGYQGVDGRRPIVTGMVTRQKAQKRRLFLKEHRKAKKVSAAVMAEKLGIERESVHRLEREPWRVDSDRQLQWAVALGIEPEDLWRPPGTPSIDAMVQSEPAELREKAADIVRRLISK